MLSEPLLESIFDPHSIGHDGAVIIDRGRLVRFGCHLPLSTSVERIGNLGLRHTAALGLSERTDVTCIVVSEERGTVSVAYGGRIDVLKSPTELSMILERLYGKKIPKGARGHILGWFRRNPLEKATAILLASLLWVAFGYQKDLVRRDVTLPIEYRNLSPQWVIEGTKITEAKVTLSGPEQAFNLLNPANLRISVDLSGVREGRQEIELANDMIKTPANVSVVSVTPSRIIVNASRLRSMVLPVDVRSEGALPAGGCDAAHRGEADPCDRARPEAFCRDGTADSHGTHRSQEGDGDDHPVGQAGHPARGVFRGGQAPLRRGHRPRQVQNCSSQGRGISR